MAMNARQLPAMVSDAGAQQYQYHYDANGNVSTILDQTLGDAYSRTMEYDARDRLRVAASPSFGGMDRIGNPIGAAVDAKAIPAAANAANVVNDPR